MSELIICEKGPALPLKTVVAKVGIIGMSGSGKTQTARKLAEAMLEAQQHIAVFDPTGAWWGLRSSADGESAGFPIVVFGGSHGDAPLDAEAGAALAKALLAKRFNAIFDLSRLAQHQTRRFVTDFLGVLNVQAEGKATSPLHLFLDEFDVICPQAKTANSEEVREACNWTVRRGRIRGIGVTMITQNPQDADKSVLNMADTVIAMRTQGAQAIDATGKWMGRNLAKDRLQEMMGSLPGLPTGTGWVWAPQIGVFEQARFLLCHTFDSSKTPELGETIEPPKILAQVDIAALGQEISRQVQQEQEESVPHLQARIAQLERSLREQAQTPAAGQEERVMGLLDEVRRVETELAEAKEELEASRTASARVVVLEQQLANSRAVLSRLGELATGFLDLLKEAEAGLDDVDYQLQAGLDAPVLRAVAEEPAELEPSPAVDAEWQPNAPQQRILNALATLQRTRIPITDELVALTAGTTPRARGFEENLRLLRKAGFVDRRNGHLVVLKGGRAETSLPTFEGVMARLSVMLSSPQVAMLTKLKAGPVSLDRLAAEMDTTVRARGFEENVRRLLSLGCVKKQEGKLELIGWLKATTGGAA